MDTNGSHDKLRRLCHRCQTSGVLRHSESSLNNSLYCELLVALGKLSNRFEDGSCKCSSHGKLSSGNAWIASEDEACLSVMAGSSAALFDYGAVIELRAQDQ